MPIDASIPLGAKTPEPMTTLGNVMNVARSAQQLQLGNVELQKNEIMLKERKGVQELFANADQFKGEDGQIDWNRLIDAGMKVAPTTFPTMIPQVIQANKYGTEAKQAFSNLNESTRAAAGQWLVSQKGRKPEDIAKDAEEVKKLNPALAPALDSALKLVGVASKGGQPNVDASLARLSLAAMPPAQQLEATTPGGPAFNTGQASGIINTKPMAGPVGPVAGTVTQNVISPAQAETPSTDVVGNPVILARDQSGAITPKAMPGAQTPPMLSFPPGESAQTAQALAAERQAAQVTLTQAPILHATNRGVLEEIDKVTATGTPGPRIQKIMSTAGVVLPNGWGGASAEEKASAYDLVGKYLERNALQAAQGMDPHTNAALESQIRANGSVQYNPTAIKKITKLNDAIVSGTEAYQPGLEKAIASSPNQIFAKRQFDQQWAQNFDVRVMQLYNAHKANDKNEVADIVKSVGGANSVGAKELAQKAKNIELLSTQGRL